MNKPLRIVLALAAICALATCALAGCTGSQSTPSGSSGTTVSLDGEGIISVPLDYSAGTGFEWQCSLPEGDDVLSITEEWDENLAEGEDVDGGPLRHWVTMRATNPGATTLTCELVRPGKDGEHGETQTYYFTVDDNLQITFHTKDSNYTLDPVWSGNS